MSAKDKKYRFLLIPPFRIPESAIPKKVRETEADMPTTNYPPLKWNWQKVKPLLEDVDWELHEGALAPHGDWPVENREEMCLVAAARLPIVRKACESGKYNGIILFGGGEPGFLESREISRKYNVVVMSNAFSQMHMASMLGNKFSVIDLAESHNMHYYNLVVQHHFADRCASIRNINYPLIRPGRTGDRIIWKEREKAAKGEKSQAVEDAVKEAVAAIEEDGAEVIICGCSGTFWLQPYLQERLNEMGWEIPVLEGFSCAITLAKTFVDLGVNVSGLSFPGDFPKQWRRKKVF